MCQKKGTSKKKITIAIVPRCQIHRWSLNVMKKKTHTHIEWTNCKLNFHSTWNVEPMYILIFIRNCLRWVLADRRIDIDFGCKNVHHHILQYDFKEIYTFFCVFKDSLIFEAIESNCERLGKTSLPYGRFF